MDINQQILDYCMEKWNKRFDGISSHNVASKLGIDHKKVRKAFKSLLKQNKGTLSEKVMLRPFKIGSNDQNRATEVITTIFFPSKESLQESFNKKGFSQKSIPEFKKRLHLGHRKSELAYFSNSVLKRYFDFADKFSIQDSLFGGFLSNSSANTGAASEEEQSKNYSFTLRFGKRRLDENEQVVTAILDDLAELPESEQQHWYFSEIEHPNFSLFDLDFHKYHLRYYDGMPVDTKDPLNKLLEVLKKINMLPGVKNLFNKLDDVELRYPVTKKYQDFCGCCDRLYAVIGFENIDANVLKSYLRKNYNYDPKRFKNEEKGQSLNIENLFKLFLKETGYLQNSIDTLVNQVKEHRVPVDHRVTASKYRDHDYLSEFKKMCQSLLISFSILYEKLRK